ncbi:MAG: D-2-hydroxyacid dehydrogenase, partial [Clostridia bacterium]|nr:D-2-hydroxyacid dehydrogenase [Clostridia bacterium]
TGLINKDTIAKMKDGVLFINTSRGGLIVEQDVADALRSGKIAGAGIDALIREPITFENPLFTAPNLLLTPHFGWAPFEARQRLLQIAEDNLRCFLEGKPINVVN